MPCSLRLYDAASDDGEQLPVYLNILFAEDRSCIFGDRFESAGGKGKNGRSGTRETDA